MEKFEGKFMKILKRISALALSLILSLSFLISCDWVLFIPVDRTSAGLPEYTLTEEYVEETKSLLKQAENTTLNNKPVVEVNFAWSQFISRYYEIATQANVAFILYTIDSGNTDYKEEYLFANKSYTEIYGLYTNSLKRIYNSPGRELFFNGWTQAEVDIILKHDEEVVSLEKQNAELEVEYSSLSEIEFTDGSVEIYKKIVANNNRMANKMGYDNYYDYASKEVYERDYSPSQLAYFREKVSSTILPLANSFVSDYKENLQMLSISEKALVSDIKDDPYNATSTNYWDKYIASYGDSTLKSKFNHAFENKNLTLATGLNSREMAFTANLPSANKHYCYFGPGYQDVFTVAHEIGHYSAGLTLGLESVSMDLKETHSQSNEMLLLEFLEDEISPNVYEVLKGYAVGNLLAAIVVSSIIDEFEYNVYTSTYEEKALADYTSEDFDNIISEICEKYGGKEHVDSVFTEINHYWRNVVVEQPVYYISYATSGLASINLFVLACQNRSEARNVYEKLISQADTSLGFATTLETAGYVNPFTNKAFDSLTEFFNADSDVAPLDMVA